MCSEWAFVSGIDLKISVSGLPFQLKGESKLIQSHKDPCDLVFQKTIDIIIAPCNKKRQNCPYVLGW